MCIRDSTTPSNFNASARQLVVGSGSGDNGITIFAGNTNNSSLFLADGTTGTNGYRGSVNYLHNGDALTLHANATETMRLTNGTVGIGTSSPSCALDVNGGSANGNVFKTTTSGDNNYLAIDNTSTGGVEWVLNSSGNGSGNGGGAFAIQGPDSNTPRLLSLIHI